MCGAFAISSPLASNSAQEKSSRVLRDVVAALDRDLFDGVRHVLHGDLEKAVRDGLNGLGLRVSFSI